MHFVLYWNADHLDDENTTSAVEGCFADYSSAQPFPQFHVIHVTGHGHQERIHKALRKICTDLTERNVTFLISPLIVGGDYQGRLFEADMANQVNALTVYWTISQTTIS